MCCCVPPLVGCVESRQRLKGPRENGNFKQRRDLKYLSFCLVKKYGSITDETETGRQTKEMIGCWSGMVGDRLVKADQQTSHSQSALVMKQAQVSCQQTDFHEELCMQYIHLRKVRAKIRCEMKQGSDRLK